MQINESDESQPRLEGNRNTSIMKFFNSSQTDRCWHGTKFNCFEKKENLPRQ